ncbi:MAG TPA: endo-1,3-alpha-glucanase family glycosylhydrolase [Acidobacteriaceae bacterium]|jgi:hypothetical protein|nr:endo-1,3-alpha-glucanase family glycosylhydrolase [Acidobacteriaceae bacterium]
MFVRASSAFFCLFFLFHGCSASAPIQLKYTAAGPTPEILATYEAWFGPSNHISVGYSSNNPDVLRRQIEEAKALGISGFVVDWYGDRDPFIDQSYATLQGLAAKEKFHIAMMYDENNPAAGATDEVIADFTAFHNDYLSATSPGHEAYLTYQGRPMIFVFPHGGHTDWARVREVVNQWNPKPWLIQENLPGPHPQAFDGFYPWVNPGAEGWKADGSNWGQSYLDDFYHTMAAKYQDDIVVGGAWPQFNDSKASWSLNRHMSARCGQTLRDTFNEWKKFFPAGQTIPFLMIETWNDYEEGTDIERSIPACNGQPAPKSLKETEENVPRPAQ